MVKVDRIITEKQEIAGVTIEVFEDIVFEDTEVDLFNTPLWVDAAMEVIQRSKDQSYPSGNRAAQSRTALGRTGRGPTNEKCP